MSAQPQVVVIGAGPVGMVAGLALARAGVEVVILEAGHELSPDSRASTFHPPTLEILDELGIGEQVHERGLIATNFQYRDRHGTVFADLHLDLLRQDTAFPYRLQCEQNQLTDVIAGVLPQYPCATLRFDARVERVERGRDEVSVFLPGDGREPSYRAPWVLATDGASSTVRKSLGIAFEGVTLPERFLVVSTTEDLTRAFPGLALVSYVSDPQEWGVLLRTPRHWRVLMPVEASVPDQQALDPDVIEARLQQLSARAQRYRVEHTSIYAVHQRVAATFAAGRVLLAGDSAHANNPLGGMGMNSGIHDAQAAVDSILAARAGADPDGCAAAYDQARRGATIAHVQATTRKNYAELREPDTQARHRRTTALAELAADPVRARSYLLGSSMIRSVAHSRDRLAAGLRAAAATRPAPGRRLADASAAAALVVPGCHDEISARLAARTGFGAVHLSEAGLRVGRGPDTIAPTAAQIRRLAAVGLPVIADSVDGSSDPSRAAETVREFERSGAAAVRFHDRYGAGSAADRPVGLERMVAAIGAAVAAREQMLVIARTDTADGEDFASTSARARAYAEAGADLLGVDRRLDPEQLGQLHRRTGKRLVLVADETDEIDAARLDLLGDRGVALVLHPVAGLLAAAGAVRDTYAAIATATAPDGGKPLSWAELTDLLTPSVPDIR